MKPDPIVEELRQERIAHAERFGFDVARIAAEYRRIEAEKYPDRLVSGHAKPAPPLRKTGS